jgi:hypothetical protein
MAQASSREEGAAADRAKSEFLAAMNPARPVGSIDLDIRAWIDSNEMARDSPLHFRCAGCGATGRQGRRGAWG